MAKVVAVVGATGAVGREMLRTLERRRFPVGRLVALASARSAGTRLPFGGKMVAVEELKPGAFAGVDVALFSAGAGVAREFAPIAARAGAVVIDNSSAWRMDPDVPLVVPEVNMRAAASRPKGIIANPNCSTIQMVVALKPLHDAARLRHVVVSTYQATSGKGHAAAEELRAQAGAALAGLPPEAKVFPAPIAFNVLCDWKAGEADYSEEEWKMVNETRKILGDASIGVSPTTVRVPVVNGHCESVHAVFERPMTAREAKELLRTAEGVVLMDDPYAPGKHPQPLQASGTDPVYVGRVRDDLAVPGAIAMWIVSDNLRKGAALNAVQIAERLEQGAAGERMNRVDFFRCVEALEAANRSPPGNIAALQDRRLRALLAHAAERSPFYREKLAGFDLARCPLSALPTTSKGELQARFDDVVTDRALRREEVRAWAREPRNAGTLYLGRYVPCVTSGTTGQPALVVYDEEALFRSCYAPGVARGGAPRAEGESGPPPRMRGESRQAFVCETRALAPSHVAVKYLPAYLGEARIFSTTRSIAALVEELNDFRPNAIWCYPSILELLARERLAGRLRVLDAPGARLTVSGEPLGESARALARRAWGLEVADSYGMTECLSVARTCPEGAMHVMSDLCILEVLGGDGRPVPDGGVGNKIAITNLLNFAQPVVRCEVGDVTGVSPHPCPCGWPFPVLLPVGGRTADLFYVSRPEGGFEQVPWSRFGFVFLIEGLRRSQLAQTGRDRFIFSYERAAPGVPLDLEALFARELERVGLRGRIEVELREDPTLGAGGGKFRQFVNLAGVPRAEDGAGGGEIAPGTAGGFPM